jgi:hypothetical protein
MNTTQSFSSNCGTRSRAKNRFSGARVFGHAMRGDLDTCLCACMPVCYIACAHTCLFVSISNVCRSPRSVLFCPRVGLSSHLTCANVCTNSHTERRDPSTGHALSLVLSTRAGISCRCVCVCLRQRACIRTHTSVGVNRRKTKQLSVSLCLSLSLSVSLCLSLSLSVSLCLSLSLSVSLSLSLSLSLARALSLFDSCTRRRWNMQWRVKNANRNKTATLSFSYTECRIGQYHRESDERKHPIQDTYIRGSTHKRKHPI